MGYCTIAFPKGVSLPWLSSASNAFKEPSVLTKLSLLGGVGKGNLNYNIIRKGYTSEK
jgi:hypothetical protein